MTSAIEKLRLNPNIDRAALREEFDRVGRIQVRDVLEQDAADDLARLLIERTPWGLSWQAGKDGPHRLRSTELQKASGSYLEEVQSKLTDAMRGLKFSFVYSQYLASSAAAAGWSAGPDHDRIVHDINSAELLTLVQDITGLAVARGDAQVTHFGPGQFLSLHEDVGGAEDESRVVAYVLNLCTTPWRADWGGYLNFLDADGDVIHGYRPRFNALNLFKVPAPHNVSFVTPYAAQGRLAVTGWFHSR